MTSSNQEDSRYFKPESRSRVTSSTNRTVNALGKLTRAQLPRAQLFLAFILRVLARFRAAGTRRAFPVSSCAARRRRSNTRSSSPTRRHPLASNGRSRRRRSQRRSTLYTASHCRRCQEQRTKPPHVFSPRSTAVFQRE